MQIYEIIIVVDSYLGHKNATERHWSTLREPRLYYGPCRFDFGVKRLFNKTSPTALLTFNCRSCWQHSHQ